MHLSFTLIDLVAAAAAVNGLSPLLTGHQVSQNIQPLPIFTTAAEVTNSVLKAKRWGIPTAFPWGSSGLWGGSDDTSSGNNYGNDPTPTTGSAYGDGDDCENDPLPTSTDYGNGNNYGDDPMPTTSTGYGGGYNNGNDPISTSTGYGDGYNFGNSPLPTSTEYGDGKNYGNYPMPTTSTGYGGYDYGNKPMPAPSPRYGDQNNDDNYRRDVRTPVPAVTNGFGNNMSIISVATASAGYSGAVGTSSVPIAGTPSVPTVGSGFGNNMSIPSVPAASSSYSGDVSTPSIPTAGTPSVPTVGSGFGNNMSIPSVPAASSSYSGDVGTPSAPTAITPVPTVGSGLGNNMSIPSVPTASDGYSGNIGTPASTVSSPSTPTVGSGFGNNMSIPFVPASSGYSGDISIPAPVVSTPLAPAVGTPPAPTVGTPPAPTTVGTPPAPTVGTPAPTVGTHTPTLSSGYGNNISMSSVPIASSNYGQNVPVPSQESSYVNSPAEPTQGIGYDGGSTTPNPNPTGGYGSDSSTFVTSHTSYRPTQTTSSDGACATQPEPGTYCGFINPEDPCAVQPDGYGPHVEPDTVEAFRSYAPFHEEAKNAKTPDGYNKTFTDLNFTVRSTTYLGLQTFHSYDVETCADLCDNEDVCTGFNIFIERDPSLNPSSGCTLPSSITNYKCTLWGSSVDEDTATDDGQYRGDFHVVTVASNAYHKVENTIPGWQPPKQCGDHGEKAHRHPKTCIGTTFFPGPYDANRCADYAQMQNRKNSDSGDDELSQYSQFKANFFNSYMLTKNGKPLGTYCSIYSEQYPPSKATYAPGWQGGAHWGVESSYQYSIDPNYNFDA